jgi:beta-aspartyl-peptidase (threonine type)
VHGGAGAWPEFEIAAAQAGCQTAAQLAWTVLHKGGTALDAVETAIVALENDPLFNAGTGSCLNQRGEIEMDASIMDGAQHTAGAVATISRYKNPIQLARKVMDDGRHVLLAGAGAEAFALTQQCRRCDPADLRVPKRVSQWQSKHGTVGCVALDTQGRLAAGTSTGGLFDKLPGRISDSALIGCGTYADTRGAVSCTGFGEAIIRFVLAKTTVDALRTDVGAMAAAQQVIAQFTADTHSQAGLILIDNQGTLGFAHNCQAMPIAFVDSTCKAGCAY